MPQAPVHRQVHKRKRSVCVTPGCTNEVASATDRFCVACQLDGTAPFPKDKERD